MDLSVDQRVLCFISITIAWRSYFRRDFRRAISACQVARAQIIQNNENRNFALKKSINQKSSNFITGSIGVSSVVVVVDVVVVEIAVVVVLNLSFFFIGIFMNVPEFQCMDNRKAAPCKSRSKNRGSSCRVGMFSGRHPEIDFRIETESLYSLTR
jgi:hypothetical protein